MPDERDLLFEKALARQLRADSAGESLCLDPEALAAYHERSLSPEELSSAKSHIASCARCQQILAQLEATQLSGFQGLHLQTLREEVVVTITEAKEEVNELRETPGLVPALAAGRAEEVREEAVPAAAAPDAGSRKAAQIPRKKSFSLGWAVPAGAIAAGLLLWIGVREFHPQPKSATEPTQVAQNRPEAARSEEYSATARDIGKQKEPSQVPNQTNQLTRQVPASPSPVLRDDKKEATLAGNLPAPATPGNSREYLRRSRVTPMPAPSAVAGQTQAADSIQHSGAANVGGVPQQVEVTPEAPALETAGSRSEAMKSAVAGPAASPAPAPAPPPPPVAAKVQNQGAAGLAQSEIVSSTEVSRAAAYSRAARKVGLDIRIAAPDGKNIWSVGPNGQILYSWDGGHTWMPQSGGVSTALTAGSAPSNKVCWIAGAAGTLLRTADGGKHWQAVQTPISSDLGGVHAADAQHASIWDLPNRVSYETSDGGATWKQTANQ